jgi:D-3-phosphoglycerate dehydrogenase / 2-oxoglutarate reductase
LPGKVLLLENISAVAVEVFREAGYDVESHQAALEETGKIAGAAVEVLPKQPESGAGSQKVLHGLPNGILAPHLGGSTEEARQNIGWLVSAKWLDYVGRGESMLNVNLPHGRLE